MIFLALALAGFPLVSYARARAEALGLECKGGTMTRPVRVIVLGVTFWTGGFLPAIAVMGVWSYLTTLHRIIHVRRLLAAEVGA